MGVFYGIKPPTLIDILITPMQSGKVSKDLAYLKDMYEVQLEKRRRYKDKLREKKLAAVPQATALRNGQCRQHPKRIKPQHQGYSVSLRRADGASMDEAWGHYIKIKLQSLIEKAVADKVDTKCLAFSAGGLVAAGFYLVTPVNEHAQGWLLSCDFGKHEGVAVISKAEEQAKASVWIPGPKELLPADPFKSLLDQNKHRTDIVTSEWNFETIESLSQGTLMVFNLPQRQAAQWSDYHCFMSFQGKQVLVKLIKSTLRGDSHPKCVGSVTLREDCNLKCVGSVKLKCSCCNCKCTCVCKCPR